MCGLQDQMPGGKLCLLLTAEWLRAELPSKPQFPHLQSGVAKAPSS